MNTVPRLPEEVSRDLRLYLAEGEAVQKCIASASGMIGRLGELWMVLTDRTVLFHTREFGKEAVVALLPRRDIQSILYFQSRRGYTLTFTPRSSPQNITRVSFPRSQREVLEDFCGELADLIEFQAEGHPPIKPGEPLSPELRPPSPPITSVTAPSPASARQTGTALPAEAAANVPPVVEPPQVEPVVTTDVRIVRPTGLAADGTDARVQTAELKLAGGEGPGLRYSVLATLTSLAVSFLWYRLFRSLGERD
ncbi:MAG TPA: hypothetical protein PLP29_07610 [Candidatus Ozemobacteraceae bacterium]|nr:hypothetical protein [Candidatus Ozemobacteraceae bacterium]